MLKPKSSPLPSADFGRDAAADTGSLPAWQQQGRHHIWMPYSQMKTAPLPAPVVATEGVYLVLDDGTTS